MQDQFKSKKIVLQEGKQGQGRKKIDIVLVSDTHGHYQELNRIAYTTKGDIFIHAGDFTQYGREQDFIKFYEYLDKMQSYRYKIVIAGNHQISLDNGCIIKKKKQIYLNKYKCSFSRQQIIYELKKRCIYLEHDFVQIQGVKIFGSPYTPYFVGNAFQYKKNSEDHIWNAIPHNIDLLVTHGPPYGILDLNSEKKSAGSMKLKQVVFDRKPKYHIFGHIHQSFGGIHKQQGITFANVANSTLRLMI